MFIFVMLNLSVMMKTCTFPTPIRITFIYIFWIVRNPYDLSISPLFLKTKIDFM